MHSLVSTQYLLATLFFIGYAASSSFSFNSYTALGDSYAAGLGSGKPVACPADTTCDPTCLRSTGSFAYLLDQKYAPSSFQYNACTGANTSVCESVEVSGPSADFGSPDLVTLLIGGDNGNAFRTLVLNCVYLRNISVLRSASCADSMAFAIETYSTQLPTDVTVLLKAAQTTDLVSNSPRTVLVFGYPQLYNTNTPSHVCETDVGWPSPGPGGIRQQLNNAVLLVNRLIAASANATGARYVDVDALFEGHRFCEGNGKAPWFNNKPLPGGLANIVADIEKGLGCGDHCFNANLSDLAEESFHPTDDGQIAYLSAAEAALGLTSTPVAKRITADK